MGRELIFSPDCKLVVPKLLLYLDVVLLPQLLSDDIDKPLFQLFEQLCFCPYIEAHILITDYILSVVFYSTISQ